jgi:hypothetical protein
LIFARKKPRQPAWPAWLLLIERRGGWQLASIAG